MHVCLQGGGELQPGCEGMDRDMLALAAGGRVVVAAYGLPAGASREQALVTAVHWYARLGALDIVAAKGERVDGPLLASAAPLVLTTGSPARWLRALTPHAAALRRMSQLGGAISASGGSAMVLCSWTVLPEQVPPSLARGLGVFENALLLPRYSSRGPRWLDELDQPVPADTFVLGVPAGSGLLVEGARLTAVGQFASTVLTGRTRDLEPGDSLRF